jgi:hypothetical protein
MSVRYSSPCALLASRLATARSRNPASTTRMPLLISRSVSSSAVASLCSRIAATASSALVDEELRKRLRRQQRHVAVRHDDGALGPCVERLERDPHGVAGAVLLLLDRDDDPRVVRRHGLGDLLAVMAHDGDRRAHAGARDRDEGVLEHAAASCRTLARDDFIRVPAPAASTMAVTSSLNTTPSSTGSAGAAVLPG